MPVNLATGCNREWWAVRRAYRRIMHGWLRDRVCRR
jgi:hypothetical protein